MLVQLDIYIQKSESVPHFLPYTEVSKHYRFAQQLKWIEDLNIRPETIKWLEENKGKASLYCLENNSLDMNP